MIAAADEHGIAMPSPTCATSAINGAIDESISDGNGGREHALAWKAAQSPLVELFLLLRVTQALRWSLHCKTCYRRNRYPGAAGFRAKRKDRLTIVGPEAPLVKGVVDTFRAPG